MGREKPVLDFDYGMMTCRYDNFGSDTMLVHSPGHRRGMSLRRKEALTGWTFVLPTPIGFAIFTFRAIIYSFYISPMRRDSDNSQFRHVMQ